MEIHLFVCMLILIISMKKNKVTWAVQYDPITRTISVPDNWINAYCDGVKFTPNKIITVWGRKFK